MIKVICRSERKNVKSAINVGQTYYLDETSLFSDSPAVWYAEIYSVDGRYIGVFNINHFASLRK